jgi:hypothetical protein
LNHLSQIISSSFEQAAKYIGEEKVRQKLKEALWLFQKRDQDNKGSVHWLEVITISQSLSTNDENDRLKLNEKQDKLMKYLKIDSYGKVRRFDFQIYILQFLSQQ